MGKQFFNIQSHDNGASWRIIDNWEFRKIGHDTISLSGMYSYKTNYYVHAQLTNGEIVYYNPRGVHIPKYAKKIVEDMFGL